MDFSDDGRSMSSDFDVLPGLSEAFKMTLHYIFVILSLVCIFLAAIKVDAPRVALGWLGIFLYVMATIIRG